MKDRIEHPQEPPAPPAARWTGLLAGVALVALGLVLIVAGLMKGEPRYALAGLVVVGAGLWARGGFRHEPAGDDAILAAELPLIDEARAGHLLALLEQWEAMELKRGSPDFDPWALQVVRNDIRRAVESDPELEKLFSRLRQLA